MATRPCSFSFPYEALTASGFQKGEYTQGEHAVGLFLEMSACPLPLEEPQGRRAGKVPGHEEGGTGPGRDAAWTSEARQVATFVLGCKGGPWRQIKAQGERQS